tara:strand:+ start:4337 stop:4738 length:402 start_codon:yes stop_codon:yes gene_type:complete
MTSSTKHSFDLDGVLLAEQRRCEALKSDDFDTLRDLISTDIVHTHTRGNTDDFDSFFHHIQNRIEFVSCTRGPLSVRIIGSVAIMTGRMQNIVRLRGESDDITVSAQVMQAWEWQGDRWVLFAFQATTVPGDG